jgi:hypothetical protein
VSGDNFAKLPIALSLPDAVNRLVAIELQKVGKSLPAKIVSRSGAFVTISLAVTSAFTFPNLTVPVLGSQYLRLPLAAGDTGAVVALDARLANITGQGGTPPTLDPPGNLAALFFVPLGSKSWPSVGSDGNLVLYASPDCLVQITPMGVTITGSAAALTVAGQIEGSTLKADNGWTGTFATGDHRTATVVSGIITNVA